MPALTEALNTAPLASTTNALASIETRVINPVFLPSPLITGHVSSMNVASLNVPPHHPLNQLTQMKQISRLTHYLEEVRCGQRLKPDQVTTEVTGSCRTEPILLQKSPFPQIIVAAPSPTASLTLEDASNLPLPRAANYLSFDTLPEDRMTTYAPYFQWTFHSSTTPKEFCGSTCNARCRQSNSFLSKSCCLSFPESHSSTCDASSDAQYELWEFRCEHVGTTVTPLTALAYEFWKSPAMDCLRQDIPELSFEEWVTRYPVARRPLLREARERVRLSGLSPRDARVDVFLKSETTTKMTDPRNISPRSDEMLTTLGPVISSIEHALTRPTTEGANQLLKPGCPSLVKGLDLTARAKLLDAQLKGYQHFIETDYSRFDRTVSLPILRDVQDYIFKMCNTCPDFHRALELAHHTTGKSALGVRYDIEGTRCSGDAHTSVGNGIINAFLTFSCLRHIPRTYWTSVHEGDDGVIGVTQHLPAALIGLSFLTNLGFSVKQDVYNQIDDVSFCGRHHYTVHGEIREHADVLRTLAKYHTTVSNCKSMALIRAKALSYYSTDSTTPLIGPLAYALLQCTETVSFSSLKRAWNANDRWLTNGTQVDFTAKHPLKPISLEARLSVYRRTNITPAEQMWYEAAYLQMAERKTILVPPRIPVGWELREDGHVYGRIRDWIKTQ